MSDERTEQVRAEGERKGAACPICGRTATPALHPFCSQRCADVDLGRWFSDAYVIAGDEGDALPEDE